MKTLSDIYEQIIDKKNSKRTYVLFEKNTVCYHELKQSIHYLTAMFSHYSLCNGHRVVICSDNDEVLSLVTVSALLNGIAIVILPADIKPNRANALITKSNPELIIADSEKIKQWGDKNNIPSFPVVEQKRLPKSSLLSRFKGQKKRRWFETLNQYGDTKPSLIAAPDDIAFINFTSGTTADPKGVQLSYRNVFSHLVTLGRQYGYNEHSHILNNLVLSHADGMIQGPILAMYFSASLYRPFSTDLQKLECYLNSIHREGITHVITVPTILGFIDRFALYDDYFKTSSFKYLISVAGMLNSDLWQRIEQRFSLRICNIYGLTETVAGGVFCGPDDKTYRRGSIGKPLDMALAIIAPDGQRLESPQEGEIIVKGDNVFSGYLDDEKASVEVMSGEWFKTGDLGYQDEQGFNYICGRKKELIITGGLNVHPAEVNEALMKHDSVVDVATFGQAHPDMQEIVISAVVLKPDKKVDTAEIIDESRKWLEEFKIPKKVLLVNKLPRGDSGKVRIPELKLLLDSVDITGQSSLTLAQFFSLIAKELYVDPDQLSLSSRSGETPGWDSLGHLNLVLAVEKAANISLSAKDILSITSLNDLWEIIKKETDGNG